MYQRRSASGAASGAAVRLNPANEHGNGSSIAASGTHVYAVWVHLAKYFYARGRAHPRVPLQRQPWERRLERRPEADHQRSRIDPPSVAAAGKYVYVSYVNSDTGNVILLISGDYGAHFHDSGIGMVSFANGGRLRVLRVHFDRGCGRERRPHMGSRCGRRRCMDIHRPRDPVSDFTLTSGDRSGPPRVAALGDRLAFAITTSTGVKARVWQAGTLGAEHMAASFAPNLTLKRGYQVAVGLTGSAGLGLAWSACRIANCSSTESPAKGVDVVWRESVDNGVSWKSPLTLGPSTGTSPVGKQRRMNAYASVVYVGAKRFVIWDAFSAWYGKGSQLLRIGSGTP